MIYRGEIYYGPEHKSIFVIYGSAESVSEALYQADTYIRMTRKYKYVSTVEILDLDHLLCRS